MMLGLALSICNPGLSGGASTNIVAVGDSLTYGQGSTSPGGATAYPAILGDELGLTVTNLGVPGLSSFDLPDPDYLLVAGAANRLLVMIGVNDIYGTPAETGAAVYARLAAYVADREASGWAVTVGTLTGNTLTAPAADTQADALNTLIRANFDSVADVAADPDVGFSASGSATYFFDQLHFKDAGYQRIGEIFAAVEEPTASPGVVQPEFGVVRDAHLTAWIRDWLIVSLATVDGVNPEVDDRVYNIATQDIASKYFSASGAFAKVRRTDANGYPALDLTDELYIANGRTWADFITESAFTIEVVAKVEAVTRTDATAYQDHGIVADNAAIPGLGLFVKSNGGGGAQVQGYVYDGAIKQTAAQTIPLGSYCRVRMKLSGGTLSVSVNGAAAITVACGDVDALTAQPRIGRNFNLYGFDGKLAEFRIYDNADTSREATNDAYDAARYGL
jgi:lysophospholipase L1-like esterase